MGNTERIAKFIVNTTYNALPEEAVRTAKQAITDCLGCALVGSADPSARIMREYVKEIGGKPEAGVIASHFRVAAPEAALANGVAGHALDYDDVAMSTWIGHPSVALLPAILALGEIYHISGKKALEAYVTGFEVGARVGMAIGSAPYAKGWHYTPVLGTMGAAAAGAKILKLNVQQTRMALGTAASLVSGLVANFGTMTKPFHAGSAARNGVIAATLASRGFTANENILETPLGLCKALCEEGGCNLGKMVEELGTSFSIISPGMEIKPYPSCRFTHRAIDAMLWLVENYGILAANVDKVECTTGELAYQTLVHSHPVTGLEGKFSMQYCLAAALLDGKVSLEQFTDEKVARAKEIMEKVNYRCAENSAGMAWHQSHPDEVKVRLKNGKEYSHQVIIDKGSPQNPLTKEELSLKYRDCASTVLPSQDIAKSFELAANLERVEDIAELTNIVNLLEGG
jgi:2-methylcitrate dehydratase PrpD